MWEIPVLDGFSFSQATNSSEVTLNEMTDSSGASRRDRHVFNDSFAPAEWSFSTYVRPYSDSTQSQSVEQILWALLAGRAYWDSGNQQFRSESASGAAYVSGATVQEVNFNQSNKVTLGLADIFFVMGDTGDNATTTTDLMVYKLEDCVVNEATFDYDLEGIATINWSGFGRIIKETPISASSAVTAGSSAVIGDTLAVVTSVDAFSASSLQLSASTVMTAANGTILATVDGINSETNYIRNKLSYLTLNSSAHGSHTLALTGGNITINNNISYVTPDLLGIVNQPLGHVTGTRTVSGSFSCYVNNDDDGSADLFESLIADSTNATQSTALTFSIGGPTTSGPSVEFKLPQAHVEIPAHAIEDVISFETNFHGIPSTVGGTNELTVKYKGE